MAKGFTTEEIAIGIFGDEIERPKKPAAVADPGDQEAPAAPEDPAAEIPAGYEYRLTKQSKSARLQLVVQPWIKDRLRQFAAEDGQSLNEEIGRIFIKYINERTGNQ